MQPNEFAARYRTVRQRPLAVDGVRHRSAQFDSRPPIRPGVVEPESPARRLPSRMALTRPFQIAPTGKRRSRLWDRLQLPLLVFGGALAGFLVQALWFGIIAIVVYSIVVLALRVPSRATFMLAFMSLVTVVVLLVVKPNATLASNFATYTFLLLVTGVIALAIEARPQKRRKRPKNR